MDALLAERVQMKRRRLFDEADAIRDELQRVHGVSVWDRERVWRTGRGGGRNTRQRGPPRSLPACGHDYECGNSDSSQSGMDVSEIDAILAERLQCKFRRDFQRADALQEELFSTGPRDNQMLTPCSTSTPSTRRRLDGVEVLRHRRDVAPVTALTATHWLVSTQVLYQDNSADHPLAKLGASGQAPSGAQHWSGANGGPCSQLVLGVKPRVFPAPKPGTW